jgi:hypothetical protein
MRHRTMLLTLALAGALATPVLAEQAPAEALTGLLGVLEIPKLISAPDPNAPPGSRLPVAPRPVRLYAGPDREARVVAVARRLEDLAVIEFAYEESGAAIFGRRDGWYLVGLARGGRGWISPDDGGRFHSLPSLLSGHPAYLTGVWDGTVRRAPEASSKPNRVDLSSVAFDRDINVVGTLPVGGRLWLEVELLPEGRCKGTDVKPIARGWLPAHDHRGRLNVWFYPRGC